MLTSSIITVAGWIVAGILGIMGLFNTQNRKRRAEDDITSANLIANLKTTAELQEKEIKMLREKEVAAGKQIANLEGQLKMLSEIVQGRDPAMQAFLKDSPDLLKIAKENNTMARDTSRAITNLAEAISSFVYAATSHAQLSTDELK